MSDRELHKYIQGLQEPVRIHLNSIMLPSESSRREWVNTWKDELSLQVTQGLAFWHLNLHSKRRKVQRCCGPSSPLVGSVLQPTINTAPQHSFQQGTEQYSKDQASSPVHQPAPAHSSPSLHWGIWAWMIPLNLGFAQSPAFHVILFKASRASLYLSYSSDSCWLLSA